MRVHKYNEDNNDFENVDWKGISIFVRFEGKGENESVGEICGVCFCVQMYCGIIKVLHKNKLSSLLINKTNTQKTRHRSH